MSYGAVRLGRPRGRRNFYLGQSPYGGGAAEIGYDWITGDSDYALHLTGEDGNGSDPTDSGYYLHALTVNSTTCLTSEFKFGAGAINMNSSDIDFTPQFTFGTDNFNIEAWVYLTTGTSQPRIFNATDGTNEIFAGWDHTSGGNLKPAFKVNVSAVASFDIVGTALSQNAWHHIRCMRHGGTFYLYANGVEVGNAKPSSINFGTLTSATVGFGAVAGYFDEVLITNSIAPAPAIAGAGVPGGAAPNVTSFSYQSTDDIMGWWKFEEGSSTVVGDSSGNGNDGTAGGGMGWVTGQVGSYAGDFDGTDDYVSVPDDASFVIDRTQPFSGGGFVERDTTGAIHGIIAKYDDQGGGNEYGFYFRFNSSDEIEVEIRAGGSGNRIIVKTSGTNTSTSWQHVFFTYDGSSAASGVTIYVGGSSVGVTTVTNSLSSGSIDVGQAVTLGAREAPNVSLLDGSLDDMRIYSRVLNSNEVLALSNEGA
jgi:hypothetical protein